MIKNIIIFIICFICLSSCYDVDEPNSKNYYQQRDSTINTYFSHDTINFIIKVDTLPYLKDSIYVYSDSVDIQNNKVHIYNNHYLYINILNNYKIINISFYNTNIWKTINTIHLQNKYKYWCGDDIYLDSINIKLLK